MSETRLPVKVKRNLFIEKAFVT